MLITTTTIVFGPGRFVEAGKTIDLPDRDAHDLVNQGKATYVNGPFGRVETADAQPGPENAMRELFTRPSPRKGR